MIIDSRDDKKANQRFILAVFDTEKDILGVTAAIREKGLPIVDAYTPYPVHGLDDAMGLKPSKIPWVCLALAMTGAAGKLWFEYWTSWLDWPINIGGKPWDSLPAFLPVTFEMMVLCGGLSAVFTLFLVKRMYPGRKAYVPHIGATDDKFVLVFEEKDATLDKQEITDLLNQFNPCHIEETTSGEVS